MLVAAAVCPQPPILVPELAAGAAHELDELRAACHAAIEQVYDAAPDIVYVVGADAAVRARTFAPWGLGAAVDVPEPMPLALLVGAWLTAGRLRSFVVVDPDDDAEDCRRLGAELAESAGRVGLVALGDASARRTERAPGYVHHGAEAFDADVVQALADADTGALLAIDAGLAAELLVAGRPAWQVLAGAAEDGEFTAGVSYDHAPYGVGYVVAHWRRIQS